MWRPARNWREWEKGRGCCELLEIGRSKEREEEEVEGGERLPRAALSCQRRAEVEGRERLPRADVSYQRMAGM